MFVRIGVHRREDGFAESSRGPPKWRRRSQRFANGSDKQALREHGAYVPARVAPGTSRIDVSGARVADRPSSGATLRVR